jgi:ketose-bisphosphate aldolase
MGLATSVQLLQAAVSERCIIAAFPMFSAEAAEAIVRAADDAGAPVILSVDELDLERMGAEEAVCLARIKAERARVPVVLHLDHGTSRKSVVRCLRAGFTSIMIDPSNYPEEEGLSFVRGVVEICHEAGIGVESMAGKLEPVVDPQGKAGSEQQLADPQKAQAFIEKTGVDSLAICEGSEHGGLLVDRQARIDMTRLKEIARVVSIPLVISEASGVGDDQLRELRRTRVGKLTIGSALRMTCKLAMLEALKESLLDVREAGIRAEKAMYRIVRDSIKKLTL